jgi:hypothetical protein
MTYIVYIVYLQRRIEYAVSVVEIKWGKYSGIDKCKEGSYRGRGIPWIVGLGYNGTRVPFLIINPF